MIGGRLIGMLGAFVATVLAAYLAASTFATLSVVIRLRELEVPLSASDVLYMIGHDWLGLTGIFLPVLALGFALALPAAAGLARWQSGWRTVFYTAAGAVALVTVHLALKAAFGITPVAVARSVPGLASQALAGAAGGWLFTRLRSMRGVRS